MFISICLCFGLITLELDGGGATVLCPSTLVLSFLFMVGLCVGGIRIRKEIGVNVHVPCLECAKSLREKN